MVDSSVSGSFRCPFLTLSINLPVLSHSCCKHITITLNLESGFEFLFSYVKCECPCVLDGFFFWLLEALWGAKSWVFMCCAPNSKGRISSSHRDGEGRISLVTHNKMINNLLLLIR